jgi:hypothetical protein
MADASANLTALAMAGPSLGWTAGLTLANNQNARPSSHCCPHGTGVGGGPSR